MAVNRGAYGWNESYGTMNAALRVMKQHAEQRAQPRANDATEHDGDVIDMVQVNGVWMTPEDARKA